MKAVVNQNRKYMKTNTILNTELTPVENNDNEVIENSLRELTDNEKSFQIINNLLNQDTDNKNQSLSIRGGLLIECAKLSLNDELNIHRCNVDNANTKTISKVEIETWIESIYDNGLSDFYEKTDFKSFKKSDGKFYSHFESLRDIALAVNFMIGNFHNASKQIDNIPLCKVGLINKMTTDIIYNVNEGNFYQGNKVYMRLDFLNSLQNNINYPIKDKVMTKENGFSESDDVISQLKYKLFSVNQIINIANTIINFKEVTKNDGIDTQVQFQNHFDDVTKLINSEEVKSNLEVINNHGTPKLLNMLDVYISTALVKKEYKIILDLIKQVAESSLDDKEFMKHLEKENFVFIAQSFTKNSQTPNQLRKLIK
jgi:hypothetical protein